MATKKTSERNAYVWDSSLDRLREFKRLYGHCNVPAKYPKDRRLGIWVQNQRRFWRDGILGEDRIARLSALGFEWNVKHARWAQMFSQLEDLVESHDRPSLLKRCKGDRQLERWVNEQRRLYRLGELDPERFRRLERIGFTWDAQESSWEEMYSALVAYKHLHGNCDVPHRWPDNPTFGNWVAFQRTLARKEDLPKERMNRLDTLGFRW